MIDLENRELAFQYVDGIGKVVGIEELKEVILDAMLVSEEFDEFVAYGEIYVILDNNSLKHDAETEAKKLIDEIFD